MSFTTSNTGGHPQPQGSAYQIDLGLTVDNSENDVEMLDVSNQSNDSDVHPRAVITATSASELNPFGVLAEFTSIISERFGRTHIQGAHPSELDVLFANKLFDAYQSIVDEYVAQEDEELIIPEEIPEALSYYDYTEDSESEEDSESDFEDDKVDIDYKPEWRKRKRQSSSDISLERKKQIVDLADQHPTWSWKTLREKEKIQEITDRNSVNRFRRQLRRISRVNKYREIDQYVLENVKDCRKTFKILRASHLRTFAMQKYLEMNDSTFLFKASFSWLRNFKRRHRISSRKITKLVSRREVRDEAEILQSARDFQKEILELAPSFNPDFVWNTDQTGFQYELTSARTYTFKGEKQVFGYAQSPKNLCTHSYTVQHLISLSGLIIGNVFICLQETGGKLGRRVKQQVEAYLPSNVTLTCSSSGKMNNSLNDYFIDKQMRPYCRENVLCLVDSWGGHNKIGSYEGKFGKGRNKPTFTLKIIPEKTTPMVQPLDTYFHRQLKYLAREVLANLTVFLNVNDLTGDHGWNTRHGVIKLQSFLHFQLTAPIFQPMVKYSWYSAGLLPEKPTFMNVKEVCFTFSSSEPLHCEIEGCSSQRFMKCSQCRLKLCLHHIWVEPHFDNCGQNLFRH